MAERSRDNAYWRERLEGETKYADILQRLDSGAIPSMRMACIEAGFIRKQRPLDQLRRAWNKATWAQRMKFFFEVLPAVRETLPEFKEAVKRARSVS